MRFKVTVFLLIFAFTLVSAQTPQCPFNRGFNFGGWFQGESAKDIPNWYSKVHFQDLKTLGCDVLRLPINLYGMSGGAPDYTIDPILFKMLDRTVDWAEAIDLHIILDNHKTGELDASNPATTAQMIALWQQMAEHFKDRSNLVFYEVCNEPFGINDAEWGEMQGKVIDAIRAIDNVHTIIVSPAAMGSYYHLDDMPLYDDDNLIYTFHFYDPMLFTHQGADWPTPSMADITGVPYPYDPDRMPAKPAYVAGTWLENSFDWYPQDGNKESIRGKMDIAIQFRDQHQVPIFCGEFGALQGSRTEDRIQWYQDVRDVLTDGDIAWTMWGYSGGFGIFQEGKFTFPQDLDVPIVEALGLNVPSLEPRAAISDSDAVIIYDEILSADLNDVSFGSQTINYWDENDPAVGDICLSWKDAGHYSAMGWQFSINRDFSYLVDQGYTLSFWMKAPSPSARFDVRFVDSDLMNGTDHPWRMSKTIDNTIATMDGSWGLVEIPLSEMVDSGSWHNNQWYGSQGLFDWKKVDKLEFVAEHGSLQGKEIKLDEIKIHKVLKPELTVTKPNGGEKWRGGSTHTVTWTSKDIDNVQVEYSSDNGATWNEIVSSIAASNQSVSWQLPEISSSQCLVKISTLDASLVDQSNGTFSILDPSITVTSPNGGETWEAGSDKQVSWTSHDVEKVKIQYSVDNGASWKNVAASVNASPAQLDWTVPNDASQECLIKVSDISDPAVMDVSDAVFEITIPSSVESEKAIPEKLELHGNYPNPFNPQTTIKFGLPTSGHVHLRVYNNLGQEVGTLIDGEMDAGYHKITVSAHTIGNGLTSGIYYYRMEFAGSSKSAKMILMQ